MHLPFLYQKQILLSNFSTFGIGGPARYFAQAYTCEQMQEMLSFAQRSSLRVFILGKGSNLLFDDRGFDGLVILNKINYLNQTSPGIFHVGSGYSFARLGRTTAHQGWTGLEFAYGIPATVGGAIYMNAGANNMETADVLCEVGYVSEKGELVRLKKDTLNFSYRTSSFQKWHGAIVEGVFCLTPSLVAKKVQKEILESRLKTQPYKEKSAGCAFRNPPGISAGKLIDNCGMKGQEVGKARISHLHANFIVNVGGAKAQDVLELMQKIKEGVYKKQGIILEEEIRFISYDNSI